MGYENLTKDEYHRLVSNRVIAIYAMLPDNDIRTDILKIMEHSIDANYPSESQNVSTSDEALHIGSVVKSWRHCEQCEKEQPHYQILHCCECHN